MSKHVNGKNYFNQDSFRQMCELLDQGEEMTFSIDCIGHTRDMMETRDYIRHLKERYGDRLVIGQDDWGFNVYSLKK